MQARSGGEEGWASLQHLLAGLSQEGVQVMLDWAATLSSSYESQD